MDKPFRTYDALLDFLDHEKGLTILDRTSAKAVLSKISYFSLINGYKDIFKDPISKRYLEGTAFEDIYNLYRSDRELRSIFLKYILIAEKSIKTSFAYHFSEVYGEKQSEYSSRKNYDLTPKNKCKVKRLLIIIKHNLSEKSGFAYIDHYLKHHKNVPLWIMVQSLTLGQFAYMFDCLNATVPIMVCKDFHSIQRKQVHTMLSIMTKHRNVCAHGERFFNYRTKDCISDTIVHKKLKIQKDNGRYIKGKNDLFSEVIILKFFLDSSDFRDFYRELSKAVKSLIYLIS